MSTISCDGGILVICPSYKAEMFLGSRLKRFFPDNGKNERTDVLYLNRFRSVTLIYGQKTNVATSGHQMHG